MTKLKLGLIGGLLATGIAIPLAIHHRAKLEMHDQERMLRQQLDKLASENERLSIALNEVKIAQAVPADQNREVLRLRGEVGRLRRQLAESARGEHAGASNSQPMEAGITAQDYAKQEAIAKMNYTKSWLLAFHLYAGQNRGQFPSKFEQAESFLDEESKTEMKLQPHEFLPYK